MVVVASKSGGQHFKLFTHEIPKSASALADYQVDTANLALTKDILGIGAVSENKEGKK